MERAQRHEGTAGIAAAVFLAIGFLLFMTTGLGMADMANPATALVFIAQRSGIWVLANVAFLVTSAVGILFLAGLARRLRERTPTRAASALYLGIVGLASYAATSMLFWKGGTHLAAAAAGDQVAASHAWVAVYTVARGLDALGSALVGTAVLVGGWAIVEAQALPVAIGWLGIATGVATILQVVAPDAEALFLIAVIMMVIWLGWAGSVMRGR